MTHVALGTAADGTVFRVTSSRRPESRNQHTQLLRLDGRAWVTVHAWPGTQVLAACAAGDEVLCPALDGALYACHLRTGNFRQAKLPDPDAEVSACAALDETTALMAGGQGTGLLFVNAADLSVTKRSLSEWGVSKPGRQVHAMSRVGTRLYLGGAKGMLAVYEAGAARDLTGRPTFAAGEVLISAVAAVGEDVYVAGYSSATGHALFVVRDKVARPAELPFPTSHQRGFGLRHWGDHLLVYADTIYRGLPGRWTRWGGDFTARGLAAVEPTPDVESLCAACADGRSFLVSRDGATPLAGPE